MNEMKKPQEPCPKCGKIMNVYLLWPMSGDMGDVRIVFKCSCGEKFNLHFYKEYKEGMFSENRN